MLIAFERTIDFRLWKMYKGISHQPISKFFFLRYIISFMVEINMEIYQNAISHNIALYISC